MSQDTIPFGDDQETFASFTSIVLNVALVLVISLLLSLVTVVLTSGLAQVTLILLGAVVIGFFAYQFSESLFLSIAVALVMVKPTIVTASLDGVPEVVAVFSLLTAVAVVPEFIRLTRHEPRTVSTSLDTMTIGLPIGWMVWASLIEPLRLAGIPEGVAWSLGLVDTILLTQAVVMVAQRPTGGLWRPLWLTANVMALVIDTTTAHVMVNQQQYLPVLALTSVVVAAPAYLALYWHPHEGPSEPMNESVMVQRQWLVVGIAMAFFLVGHAVSGRGAEFFPALLVAILTLSMGIRAVVSTRAVRTIKIDRIAHENRIVQARRIDQLTGLSSRGAFMEDLTRLIDAHASVLVVIADLDQFGRINDALGPQSGDVVLADVGQTILKWRDESYLTGRLGPNSFAIAVAEPQGEAEAIATELLHLIRGEYDLGDFGHVQLGCSVGVYQSVQGDSADTVVQRAERALHQAKQIGRGTISTVTADVEDGHFPYNADELRMLISRNALVLQTRPIVDLVTNQTVALQTRVCLEDEHHISWSILQRVAREYGISRDLERWTLKESCQIALAKRTPIWVMVQARQLIDQFFVGDLQDFITAYRIPRDQITLSINDRMSFAQGPHPSTVLNRILSMGVRLSLEEFGTGAFSFSQIRELPVQTLALDGQFVGAAVRDARSRALVESVVIAASGLDVSVLATEVDREETRNIVLDAGCTLANGPLWGDWTVEDQS